jgi:tetratricopeptide (TPR) repeat protein
VRRWLALWLLATPSLAWAGPPDHWDLARSPGAERAERLTDEAEDKLAEAAATPSAMLRQQLAAEARSLLEQLGGDRARDLRARFLYGHALHSLDDDSAVIAALEPLVAVAFDHPVGIRVMFDLAVAYAKVERFRDEVRTYDRLLEAEDSPGLRSTVLSNRGESRAKLDDFPGAVADFRQVIAGDPMNVLARWGLAVVLDRWGDLSGALEEGGFAWDIDQHTPSMLDRAGVFFVPAHDKWWYHGVRRLSAAHRATSATERLGHLQAADRFYEMYLAQAPSTDRWVPLARSRRKRIEQQVLAARKQAAAGGKRPPSR